jgi:LCP family protein required for cell wall assembly
VSQNALRAADPQSPDVMTKRAWWLVGLNILIPGSAQLMAGNRRFGRFALFTTLLLWALVIVAIVAAVIWRTQLLPFVANPIVLWVLAAVLGLYGVLWVVCTLDTVRLAKLVRVRTGARFGVALLAVVALVVTGGAAFAGAVTAGRTAHVLAEVGSNTVQIIGPDGKPIQVGPFTGDANILLVGSDSGDGNAAYGVRGEALNDVTILIHFSTKSQSATAVSIPRDLYVAQPACQKSDGTTAPAVDAARFNTALARGGLSCVVAAAQQLTGLTIPYAGLIEFDGVVAMSDAIGGVPVCLAAPIDDPYTGLHLPAGQNILQGQTALSFLRTRHGLSTGSDLQRISNQQVFLSALLRQVTSSGTLGDPNKVLALAEAAAQHMQLSTDLAQTGTLVSMALALKSIPLDRIAFVQYPSSPTYIHGQSVTKPITGDAEVLMQALAADKAVAAGGLGGAAVANPNPPTGSKSSGTPTPTPTPTGAATNAPVPLPSSISGQSAGEQTCSAGRG